MEPREARIEISDYDCGQGYNGKMKTMKKILDPRETQYQPMWQKIFLLCCVVATSLDPLFFYIPIVNDQKKCLGIDEKLKKTIIVLRSVMDLTYIFHIAFQIIFGYLAYVSKSKGLVSKSDKVNDRIIGTIGRIKWWIILIDIMCVLPIPQVVIFVYFSKMKSSKSLNTRKFLNFFVIFQFVPRFFRIYQSCKELSKNLSPGDIVGAASVKGLFNFFLYIIASHVMGALWYFFSVQRESACWQHACRGNSMCNQSTFFCEHRYDVVDDPIIGYLNQSCPLIPPSRFDFGMFNPALQSGIVNTMDFPRKFFYCFAWGLRNLSSFGSNLQTSTYFWETLFSAAITVIGLLLFIYLIGNLQTYLQFSANDSEKSRRKMQRKGPKIDTWIKKNEIPSDMRKELMDGVRQKMHENEEVNLKNLLNVLPTQSMKSIKQRLCLPILKKVARLEEMSIKSIDEIFIDHLKPVIFNEDREIFREGDLLSQMLFFTQGSALEFSRAGATPVKLERGGFYGEELLEWALDDPISRIPTSQKTVKTDTKVEAFALEFRDMEKIACSWTKRKIKMKGLDVDKWIKNNEILPDMRQELMDRVPQKMHENEEVNLMNLLNVLPTQSMKRIKQRLCLPILKKVARLEEMSDKSIDEIFIDHLKPVIFNEDREIFREGDLLSQMLFFTQGSALEFSRAGATPVKLERGGFYGEELLEWALDDPLSRIPISQKTVKTDTKVEAFALEFRDMDKIAWSWRKTKTKTKGPEIDTKTEGTEIDTWIKNNEIPPDMRQELMDRVPQKMHENEEVNLMNLLNVLPTQSMKRIKQRLCLPILKKVARLEEMSDKSIDEIFIDHLKPVIFNEDKEIFKEGNPLSQMLFFTQGSAWEFSRAGATPIKVERGDFYGEELLAWALIDPLPRIPISQKTVKTVTKVEAFALEFRDMEKIACSWRKRKMKTKGPEIDKWIKNNDIPPDMRQELMDRVRQKMHENEEVNLMNLLNVLPTQSMKRIKQTLCLPILKKVARLEEMSDKSIDEIFIDHLKPVIFNEDKEIFKEGNLLSQMLFFTQGSAWEFLIASKTPVKLERGGFYGEELLEWALNDPSSRIPISQKTVKTDTKVEAFALEFRDMDEIACSWRKRKMKTKGPEIDTWIKNNEIPPDMRKELMDRVRQKMHENDEVNLMNLLNVLPTQSMKRIKQTLCLPILKKVARLEEMSDESIDEIFIDHLKPVILNEHREIFREGDLLSQMLFFTQGSALEFSRAGATPVKLERGGFYGEELLEWALDDPLSRIPISQKTVKTDTKVEAFALEFRDMDKIAWSWWSVRKLNFSSSTDVPMRRCNSTTQLLRSSSKINKSPAHDHNLSPSYDGRSR